MQGGSNLKKSKKKRVHLLRIGITNLKLYGIRKTARKTLRFFERQIRRKVTFKEWAAVPLFTEEELEAQRHHSFDKTVKFSIITPLYNTDETYLREMIESVLAQTYHDWELCMADGSDNGYPYVEEICREYVTMDSRIKYRRLGENLGIAGNSNACIDMSDGDYISILDHDDLLHPAALHETMKAICEKGADIVYTDELTFRGSDINDIKNIHFKPDYAPDNLKANNYICHFTSFRRELLDICGRFREGFDGAQDHDLILRLTKKAKVIEHIPEVLYYWRSHGDSSAQTEDNKPYAGESGKKAVRSFLESEGINATIENAKGNPTIYRVSYALPEHLPKVSIIIPSLDHTDDLQCCIDSIMKKSTYPNYEIIVVENNSREPATFRYYRELLKKNDNMKIITWSGSGFNWAELNNFGASEAAGDYLLLLNNDTEVITPEWIEEMLMHAQRPEVGIVGSMLYYPNDTIQHAGAILCLANTVGHAFSGVDRGSGGYMGRLCYAQNLMAVTGACMLMRKDVFDEVGGVDVDFAVALNDIDLCMRVRKEGYLVVWTPFAELYHYESKSRGIDDTECKKRRSEAEYSLFRNRWQDELSEGDPYYNPNFSTENASFELDRPKKKNMVNLSKSECVEM